MFQLCSGHATRSPWTMPCDNGPPLCGHRSASANTRSSAVRNTAMLPPLSIARSITRAPSRGMSVERADRRVRRWRNRGAGAVHRRAHWSTFALRAAVFALGAARRAYWSTFALRAAVFALGAARRAYWSTFALRAPVFALGAARRAHAHRRGRGAMRGLRSRHGAMGMNWRGSTPARAGSCQGSGSPSSANCSRSHKPRRPRASSSTRFLT